MSGTEIQNSPEVITYSNLSDHDSGTEQSRDFSSNSRFHALENFGSEGQLIPFNMAGDDEENENPLLEMMARKIKVLEAEIRSLKETQSEVVVLQNQNEELQLANDMLKAQLSHARSVISTLKEEGRHSTDGDVLLYCSANSDASFLSPVTRDGIASSIYSRIAKSPQLLPHIDGPPQGIQLNILCENCFQF
jgi:hypothetical protein